MLREKPAQVKANSAFLVMGQFRGEAKSSGGLAEFTCHWS
jgi:hypothetical protein